MITLCNNNHSDNDNSNNPAQSSNDNDEKNYEEILKKNPTYKKTYDNTGYLWIGDVIRKGRKYYDLKKEDEKENVKNKLFDRFKEKHILVPQNKNFKILQNKESILNFLTNIKQNYKINNFHFYLRVHGSEIHGICVSFKYINENGEDKDCCDMPSGDVDTLLQSIKEVFKDDNLYIYVTNTPCYDNDLIKDDNGETNKRFREHLIKFTKDNRNIKFLLSHHNDQTSVHVLWDKCNFAKGQNHVKSKFHFLTSSMQYEVIENGKMHTITKEEKNRIFYSPENSIKHDKIRPKDVLKYIDGDYTFLDENGNSKGKIRDIIGKKNENEYTFDDLAKDIVNTYDNTNKIRFLKRGYFKPFYDAIKKNYNTETKEITNELIQNFKDIEDTIRCTC